MAPDVSAGGVADLPQSLVDNPGLRAWFEPGPPGFITLLSGKVEIGQGIAAALRQIAAEELDLAVGQIALVSGDTGRSPYEWFTAGSTSIEVAGKSVRLAAAELRARLFRAAALRLGVASGDLQAAGGAFLMGGQPTSATYWSVFDDVDLDAAVTGQAPVKHPDRYELVGRDPRREDLAGKLAGGAYIHDMELPGMLHGRVLRKPSRTAELAALDEGRARLLPGVVRVVRDRNFVGVVASGEYQAVRAIERIERDARWLDEAGDSERGMASRDYLDTLPSVQTVLVDECAAPGPGQVHEAVYSRPLLAHGSLAPSCAIAAWDEEGIRIWTHSQGVFALRDQIARVTGVPAARIRVRHVPGAGCYGQTGADDAALDAVLLSRAADGLPVRTLWRRQDELRHEPLGSPMKVRIKATLDESGRITSWRLDTWAGAFAQRPGWNGGVNLHAAADGAGDWPFAEARDLPAHNGGSKNAVAGYDFPQTVVHHMLRDLPFRLSALRSLGAFANVFAIESFMDELAAQAGEDSVAFRLRQLPDPRSRQVIEAVAAMAGWAAGPAPGRYLGLGYARFKNKGAYCAVVAEVSADDDIRLTRVWAAIDAGMAITPDGIKAQVEGAILQAASWTLHEALATEGPRVMAESWLDYPVLGFADAPAVEVRVISDPAQEAQGVGEVALGPAAGAIVNAITAALGIRLRDLPLTRDRIMTAMLAD